MRRPLIVGLLLFACASSSGPSKCPAEPPLPRIRVDNSTIARDKAATSYAAVSKQVAPSVVSVFSRKMVKGPNPELVQHLLKDPLLSQLVDSSQMESVRRVTSLGSGVIVSPDGYIITNDHVVDGAEQVEVSLLGDDHRKLVAKVVGRDDLSDVALLKIETNGLPAISFGNSDELKVGDVVLAVGNPFDVGQTVTMGIVSALKHGGLGSDGYEDFIQTDAPINPGNSGGPLVDTKGRVVGINTAILTGSGGNQGIGFAIPSNLARQTMEQLIRAGKVVRGYLGINVQDLTPKLAKAFGVAADSQGAVITEVTPADAGAKAGLKIGDIIVDLGGHTVKDSSSVRKLIANTAPNQEVKLLVLREGKQETLGAKLQERPSPKTAAPGAQVVRRKAQKQALSGFAVADLDESTRQHLHVPGHVKGVLIVKIDPSSAAYDAGLRVGDVIEEINQKPVANAEEAVKLIRDFRQRQALVLAWSLDGTHFVAVDASEPG